MIEKGKGLAGDHWRQMTLPDQTSAHILPTVAHISHNTICACAIRTLTLNGCFSVSLWRAFLKNSFNFLGCSCPLGRLHTHTQSIKSHILDVLYVTHLSCLLPTVILTDGSSSVSTTYLYPEGFSAAWGVKGVRGVSALGVLKQFGEGSPGLAVSGRPLVRG